MQIRGRNKGKGEREQQETRKWSKEGNKERIKEKDDERKIKNGRERYRIDAVLKRRALHEDKKREEMKGKEG